VKYVKSFGQFWYDFIIGDDPKIAVAVVLALAVLGTLVAGKAFGDHGLAVAGGMLIVAFFATSLAIDVRSKKR
jgi:hypothetical protein